MDIPRISPSEAGVASQGILDFIDAVESKGLGLHAFKLIRHGAIVAEGHWAPYKPEYPHTLFSLSKSFTSTAIGFAVQEGLLSLEDQLLSFFPGKLPFAPCENMQKMQLKHLIGMCTGHSKEPVIAGSDDWVYNFLTSYVDLEPGSTFVYNSAATYMLSAVLTKVTGMTVRDYLMPRLFEPLGIEKPYWETCPKGINCGGWGLYVKTEDIARFALFLLQKGTWNGRQLLDPAWIENATSKHIDNFGATPDWHSGYGYQFWRCQIPGVYRGDGAFGQYCVIMPELDAAFVSNSGSDDLQGILDQVWQYLLPAIGKTDDKEAELKQKLSSLMLPCPTGEDEPALEKAVYRFADNKPGLEMLTYENGAWDFLINGHHMIIPDIPGVWTDGHVEGLTSTASFFDPMYEYFSAATAWEGNCCHIRLHYTRMPAMTEFTLRILDQAVEVTMDNRFSFAGGCNRIYGIKC